MSKQQNKEHKFDFAMVYINVLENKDLTGDDKIIYTLLCRHADIKTGKCYPTRETLAKNAGISVRKVTYAIRNLEKKKYISTSKWEKDSRKNVYTVHFIRDKDIDIKVKN